MKYTVKIVSHGRKWTQLSVTYSNGHTGKAKILREKVADREVGEEFVVDGHIEHHDNRFGSDPELIPVDPEKQKAEDIDRWWSYFKAHERDGHYYERAVKELHSLGCHEHDAEINEIRLRLEAKRWWGYFQDSLAEGRIYERAITELHAIGCHVYDEKIQAARKEVEEKKEQARKKKAEEEAAKGIRNLALPCRGFSYKMSPGEHFMHRGVPYEAISSYYHDSDGWSFGAMNDEWQSVKAKCIADTPEGKRMIWEAEHETRLQDEKQALVKAVNRLYAAIRSTGNRYDGGEIWVDDIPGVVLADTFSIYGGGYAVRLDADGNRIWWIENNGMDGDDWSINTIRTGGAGAYALIAEPDAVQSELEDFYAARDKLNLTEKEEYEEEEAHE